MLEDKDFIKSCDVPGPTKEAIRAIILYKSEVSSEDKVVDCGCGTGGITCEFSQRAKEVISIDTNPEAIEITEKNLDKFGLGDNVTLINDNGANALKDIDNIDIAIDYFAQLVRPVHAFFGICTEKGMHGKNVHVVVMSEGRLSADPVLQPFVINDMITSDQAGQIEGL